MLENNLIDALERFSLEDEATILQEIKTVKEKVTAKAAPDYKQRNILFYRPENMTTIQVADFFESQFDKNFEHLREIMNIFTKISSKNVSTRDIILSLTKNIGIIGICVTLSLFGLGPVATIFRNILKSENMDARLSKDIIRTEIENALLKNNYIELVLLLLDPSHLPIVR